MKWSRARRADRNASFNDCTATQDYPTCKFPRSIPHLVPTRVDALTSVPRSQPCSLTVVFAFSREAGSAQRHSCRLGSCNGPKRHQHHSAHWLHSMCRRLPRRTTRGLYLRYWQDSAMARAVRQAAELQADCALREFLDASLAVSGACAMFQAHRGGVKQRNDLDLEFGDRTCDSPRASCSPRSRGSYDVLSRWRIPRIWIK